MSYAEGTTVSAEKSRAELEHLLTKAGATSFAYAWEEQEIPGSAGFFQKVAKVGFTLNDFPIRFFLPFPRGQDFVESGGGRQRTAIQVEAAMEKETRRRWRSLVLVVKAKLEAVATGISTLEHEFLADIATKDGRTIGQRMLPDLRRAATSGKLPNLIEG